ncbi:aminotransferase-like domain-containing protein [Polluticaenibacter yanchengensis]|uniref:PLP-dependent aminotransferase family protein n=1 Tax=Polluticaenibacter yanchengensis TaxID=3014562 RepID=A0ABT4UIJ2_9BACT|nr:PLP-dependent aminotransferase family protein [Chitinophagaceae bacterium LY-5]
MFPFENVILIDKNSKVPVYRQIAYAFMEAIRNGTLKAGTVLPGTRELAKLLTVHRKTVIAAYEELNAQDWIVIIPRKHVTVSEQIPLLKPKKWNGINASDSYKQNFDLFLSTQKKDANDNNLTGAAEIFIDDGYPDIRLSPIDELLKIYRSYTLRKYAVKNTVADISQGTLRLREVLVKYLSETRGLNISANNLLITHGAQMSIYLASKLIFSPGSNVIVGIPNYNIANNTFNATGANVIEVRVDACGLDIDAVENICKSKKISAIYIIPHHHYPTTVTLSVERRMRLLELSNRYSFAIIEDDYDYDYHYASSPYLPLSSGTHNGNVIYIGSFSKILGPSMRIGFMVAPENFIHEAVALRKVIDVGGDGYMQNALAELIKNGELGRHLKKAKKHYHLRLYYLHELLQAKLSGYIAYVLPEGGMAIWITLLPAFSVDKLKGLPELYIKGIYPAENAFRFGFASMNERELEKAVDFLEKKLRHC